MKQNCIVVGPLYLLENGGEFPAEMAEHPPVVLDFPDKDRALGWIARHPLSIAGETQRCSLGWEVGLFRADKSNLGSFFLFARPNHGSYLAVGRFWLEQEFEGKPSVVCSDEEEGFTTMCRIANVMQLSCGGSTQKAPGVEWDVLEYGKDNDVFIMNIQIPAEAEA